MRYLFILIVLINTQNLYAQGFIPGDIGYNLDRLTSSTLVSPSQDAAVINANADYVYKSSLANINNEKAKALSLNNQALRASVYFEKRQINLYNRTLEEFQRQRISQLRRSKIYSKEELDALFDIRYKTGFITP